MGDFDKSNNSNISLMYFCNFSWKYFFIFKEYTVAHIL